MSSNEPIIYCPNPSCQSPNPQTHSFCQRCRTSLPHVYLWASIPSELADTAQHWETGSLLQDRYRVVGPQRLLDTRPSWMPQLPEELSDTLLTYLKLQPWRLHLPEVYGVLSEEVGEILLLEKSPLDERGELKPTLEQTWAGVSTLRKLAWLQQILALWTPLAQAGAATSLLWPENIRVDGPLVRLRELLFDDIEHPVSELQLVGLWSRWLAQSPVEQVPALQELCQSLTSGSLSIPEAQNKLDAILVNHARTVPLSIQIVGGTDTGPQRSQNEDTCYPNDRLGTSREIRLGIVCDGIGGHEGGEVASRQAVQTLRPQAQALITELDQENLTPPAVVAAQLDTMVRVVNNLIVGQNDSASREARQRMGTTLVMALAPASGVSQSSHELYITHVGDSRAYWISRDSCHQITVDDDVASREVRLGHALYREALQRSDAGALTQALGTRASDFLHPSVQRFILDDDCVILLCSDGLSDYDRVEQYWTETLRPILDQQLSLTEACTRLIELANTRNGHDNVSVVLIHAQLQPPKAIDPESLEDTLPRNSTTTQADADGVPTIREDPLAQGIDLGDVPTIREDPLPPHSTSEQAEPSVRLGQSTAAAQVAEVEPLSEPQPTLIPGHLVKQPELLPEPRGRWREATLAVLVLLALGLGLGGWWFSDRANQEQLRQLVQPSPVPTPEFSPLPTPAPSLEVPTPSQTPPAPTAPGLTSPAPASPGLVSPGPTAPAVPTDPTAPAVPSPAVPPS
ncbi:protein phosphatase 2C domain-containing protein [Leptolyngbya sp. FACHB-261]|uniref:protein phosphatase 2C domain-containing protein n=1 Tax=Leptolyngbya sp. FACHB-261 TaxID=2692806 RepID=UPI001684B647|nr:protein phosphatase 2C domain-containing protein [Leptolyngbya sp. FACHB-261]MBD2105311.1 protein phosphatase 2C domain-containing protein [Leptolyngbya sp. FACHB-261]